MKLKPLIDAYTGPYKDRYRFWTGLGLIVRILLTVLFSFTSEKTSIFNSNFFIALIVPLTIIGSSRVYRKKYNTVIEVCSHINLFVLALVATPLSEKDVTSVSIATVISVTVEACLFVAIIVVHCHIAFKTCCKGRKKKYKRHIQINYGSIINNLPSPG